MASSSPQFSHLHDPTLKASTDSALTQASELISSSLSMPPMSITQSSLPGLPSSSPTQSHVLPRATTPSSLPAQDPSLISPPSVDTRPRGDSAEVSRALTDWHAARESVVNQMVTSQDIVTPATVPRTAAKTRARRGRGSRRASTKSRGQLHSGIEGSVFTPVEATGSPSGRGRSRGTGRGRGRGRGRGGGRPRGSASGLKRKRAESEDEIRVVKHESDSSETFTQLPTQSRSGRRIFQASAFTPVVLDLEAGAEFNPLPINGIAAPVEKGKRGKMGLRKAGDASVCKNCGRGHSPASNMIVFCDGCNTPWHQHCHDRPISKDVVLIEEKEWFCADCDVLQEERLQLKETVSAEGMSLDEVRSPFYPLFCLENFLCYGLHNDISWQLTYRNDDIYKPSPPLILSLSYSTLRVSTQLYPSSQPPPPAFHPAAPTSPPTFNPKLKPKQTLILNPNSPSPAPSPSPSSAPPPPNPS